MGLSVNMLISQISAINFATGQMVATDNIRLKGVAFPVLPPNQAHKHLGVRMTLTGDFSHRRRSMCNGQQRLSAIQVLSPTFKEG